MNSNDQLVDLLTRQGQIKNDRVEKAFRKVDRALFVPEKHREDAYIDRPLQICDEATISAPHIVATNTELLEVEEDSRVLEIGSGSGYQLAILAELAEKAVGVEIVGKLAERSCPVLEKWDNAEVIHGEGLKAVHEEFDRVLFSCSIEEKLLNEAKEHLSDEGIIVAPVQTSDGQVLKRLKDGRMEEHGRVRFVDYKESG